MLKSKKRVVSSAARTAISAWTTTHSPGRSETFASSSFLRQRGRVPAGRDTVGERYGPANDRALAQGRSPVALGAPAQMESR